MSRKYPDYLNISEKELDRRIKKAYKILEKCAICPRECGVNRLKASPLARRGFCRVGKNPIVNAYHSHFGEETPLVGSSGSGTIFFTHCNLACVYCQNYDISQLGRGQEISLERLAGMMIELQNQECHNINFVSPTPYIPQILGALPLAIKKGLKLPLVYNTNSYDSIDTLKFLDGIIDIYMPDAKYALEEVGKKYSMAPNYPNIMKKALKEMFRQVGDLEIDEQGVAVKGLLVRHLVLPGGLAGTKDIMEFLAKKISLNTFVNIMAQYHPCYKAEQYPPLDSSLSLSEHQKAIEVAQKAGLKRIYS